MKMEVAKVEARQKPDKRRVLVVDDHPIVIQGLRMLINQEADLTVCGTASSVETALVQIDTMAPDIVIVDISLNGENGLEVIGTAARRGYRGPMLVLSSHPEALYAERAFGVGARGYLMKSDAMEKVLRALRRLLRGELFVSNEIRARLIRQDSSLPSPPNPFFQLNRRELRGLKLIGRGLTLPQMAQEMDTSEQAVQTHLRELELKLGFRSATELLLFAIRFAELTSED
jgi:DNA-binding NarL/FixJ family response regulator